MEAHKERREQLQKDREETDESREGHHRGGAIKKTDSSDGARTGPLKLPIDPVTKALIRESIVTAAASDSAEEDRRPDDVLAFSRSVNKIDSSLE